MISDYQAGGDRQADGMDCPGLVVGDHGGEFLVAELPDAGPGEPARWLFGWGVRWRELGDEPLQLVG